MRLQVGTASSTMSFDQIATVSFLDTKTNQWNSVHETELANKQGRLEQLSTQNTLQNYQNADLGSKQATTAIDAKLAQAVQIAQK